LIEANALPLSETANHLVLPHELFLLQTFVS